ncbi:helix-turn-helix domain-containing protein [Burkholderia anthina]|uniref:helix-turn-helix domain-containing protein n=1 Tax=Burkholderia anthina TaxID=179879 RepID=UPI00384FA1E5
MTNAPARHGQAAHEALAEEFSALDALLAARCDAGLTQAQVAERMGTTAPAVSRLEASLSSGRPSPSFSTLRKYAAACGKKLVISFA